MATDTKTTSPEARSPFYFRPGTTGPYYEVQLVTANYKGDIATAIGLTETKPGGAGDNVIAITLGGAVKEGLLFPLRIRGKKGTKKASAKIICNRSKIEEAFNALLTKTYGGLKIETVGPIMKRLVTY